VRVRRPALRYFGGKWRLAPWIISHFPPHTCYVEPFGGGASVLLRKPPAQFDVYNDIDNEVVNFFRVLRDRPDELIRAIKLTPFARAELALAYEPCDDELERARRFYVRSWQCRGGPRTQWKSGWRLQKVNARGKRSIDDWNDFDHLWAVAQRLKQVYIEHDDALAVIRRYDTPDTLFYCDPPYPPCVRSKRWARHAYQYEMSEEDHRCVADMLHSIKGMAIVSSYPNDLYDELYAGWHVEFHSTRNDHGGRATECLYISPSALARQQQMLIDLPLEDHRTSALAGGRRTIDSVNP